MAKSSKLISLHMIAIFLQFLIIFYIAETSGLSLKLIHKESKESPFYPGNLNSTERIRRRVQSSLDYAHQLSHVITSNIKRNNVRGNLSTSMLIRPRLASQTGMFMVEVGIGTFASRTPPYYKYFLHLDTGANILWTPCEDCRKMGWRSCFRQKAPLFPARQSSTYRPLPCGKHELCSPGKCINDTCSYFARYGDGARTLGYLAYESFKFNSHGNGTETLEEVVFGCGIRNQGFIESSWDNLAAGNFGLSEGKLSFISQKKSLTQGKFSYCLPPLDIKLDYTIFLRFGADIPHRKGLKETRLLPYSGFGPYYIDLKDISVGNIRLGIPHGKFARKNNGYGGCVVDSGTTYSILPASIFGKLKQILIEYHLSKYKRIRRFGGLEVCYLFPRNKGLKDLPSITFHLQDCELVFWPEEAYIIDRTRYGKEYFCLAMVGVNTNGFTIIGAFQQANRRFIFDTVGRKLYFGPENCSRGA